MIDRNDGIHGDEWDKPSYEEIQEILEEKADLMLEDEKISNDWRYE